MMDEQAFTQSVTRSRDKLFRIAYAILHNEQDCADALQEALSLIHICTMAARWTTSSCA